MSESGVVDAVRISPGAESEQRWYTVEITDVTGGDVDYPSYEVRRISVDGHEIIPEDGEVSVSLFGTLSYEITDDGRLVIEE